MGKILNPPVQRLEPLAAKSNDLIGRSRVSTSKKPQQTYCRSGHSTRRVSVTDEELCVGQNSLSDRDPTPSQQIKSAKMANARRPNTTGTVETRSRGMITEVSRPVRAATTTPTAYPLKPHSKDGSPRNNEMPPESPSNEMLDEECIAEKRARLLELLDSAACIVSRSREPVFDESRMSYHKFMRGYIDASPKTPRHRTILEEAVTNVFGEGCSSPARDDRSPFREDTDDHYKYFSRKEPVGESRCQEDNARRLQCVRIQALAARVAMTADEREVMAAKLAWSPPKLDRISSAKADKNRGKQPCLATSDTMFFRNEGEDGISKTPRISEMLESYESEISHTGRPTIGGDGDPSQGQDTEPRGQKTLKELKGTLKRQGLRQTLFMEEGETFGYRGRAQRRKLEKLKTGSLFSSNTAAQATQMKAEKRSREACESLRFLVFGYCSDEKRSTSAFYEQACGSKEEVTKLHTMWNRMDEDGSGDIEFTEFLTYFSKSKADRLLGMKCVKYLVGTGDEHATGCRIEDMMKLIWLKATKADIDLMMHWFKEAEFQCFRAPTPPLLPKRKRREILENFPSLELGAKISYEDLVDTGLVDEPTARQLQNLYDKDNTNVITAAVLLDMMCPNGYRSRKDASSAVDHEGRVLQHINNGFFQGWIYQRGGDGDDD